MYILAFPTTDLSTARKSGRGMISPFVEVEIQGAQYDAAKFKTKTISDNGYNPYWNECFDFKVQAPELALLRQEKFTPIFLDVSNISELFLLQISIVALKKMLPWNYLSFFYPMTQAR